MRTKLYFDPCDLAFRRWPGYGTTPVSLLKAIALLIPLGITWAFFGLGLLSADLVGLIVEGRRHRG